MFWHVELRTSIMGIADLHMHTNFSDGLMSPEALVEFVLTHTTLDVIAVTDHDTTAGAKVAQAYAEFFAPDTRQLDVICGMEVTSADCDILALFVEEDIPSGLSAQESIDLIHEQNGLAIAAHPYSHAPTILRMDGMKGAGDLIAELPFDGVEVINATPTEWLSNRITRYRNRRGQRLAETGGSDGHYLPTVGSAFTKFTGTRASDLRIAIEACTTSAGGSVYNPFLIFPLIREVIIHEVPVHKLPAERSSWPMAASS
jgi:predicted metal-dependent phosphoesterase TrpH